MPGSSIAGEHRAVRFPLHGLWVLSSRQPHFATCSPYAGSTDAQGCRSRERSEWAFCLSCGNARRLDASRVAERLGHNVSLGEMGVFVGSLLFGLLGIHAFGLIAGIVKAAVGAVIVLAIAHWLRGRRAA